MYLLTDVTLSMNDAVLMSSVAEFQCSVAELLACFVVVVQRRKLTARLSRRW